jgi:hypothetical protein
MNTLFDDPPSVRGSETSEAAAESIKPEASRLREIVLCFIRASGQGGLTDDEMQELIPMGCNTQRPRRVELVNAGYVFNSGRKRKTKSGRDATVWIAGGKTGEV